MVSMAQEWVNSEQLNIRKLSHGGLNLVLGTTLLIRAGRADLRCADRFGHAVEDRQAVSAALR